jgi:two-component system, OmpR family, KDP operon response regulator KdpE
MPLNLLIADDARDVAEIVAFGARMIWPDSVAHIVGDGDSALACFAAEQIDLVVLDVEMPPPDGFEVCRRLREASQVPILMLTVHDAVLEKVRALNLGADDYLTKPFDHLELLARLSALVRRAGSQAAPPVGQSEVFRLGGFLLNYATHQVQLDGVPIVLTSTEYRLLEELVRHPGKVLTHRQLLESVWGPEYINDIHYLKVFIQRLRRKLGEDPQRPQFIRTEWGKGYSFITPA